MRERFIESSIRFIPSVLVFAVTFSTQTAAAQPAAATNRPMREQRHMVVTVGQDRGDLRGDDDKIIQAGIEYLDALGGGTLVILPGVYEMRNSVYLSPNITLRGSRDKTVLKKAPGAATRVVRDSDWYEYGVQVDSVEGFPPGGGIMLRSSTGNGNWEFDVLQATITAIEGDTIYLDRTTENITIINTRFENTTEEKQKIGIRIGADAERINMRNNTFENCPLKIEHLKRKTDDNIGADRKSPN